MAPAALASSASITELLTNEKTPRNEAIDVLLRIARNILKDPQNQKFRSISLGSKVFTEKLLPVSGAMQCLFDMGFVEGSDRLELPISASLAKLKLIQDELLQRKDTAVIPTKIEVVAGPSPKPVASEPTKIPKHIPEHSTNRRPQTSRVKALRGITGNKFLGEAISRCDQVLQYEDKTLQLHALFCIPLLELNLKVEKAIRSIQGAYKKKEIPSEDINHQELLLHELITWFKSDFFSWLNVPKCPKCNEANTVGKGARPPQTPDVDRIEVYQCPKCNNEVLFPRYNDAGRLLVTRTGRCGEWANCFTLMCRAIGWDARLVHDSTDHAWTEVYLSLSKTWVHCDPCEGVIDAPLLYEAGWKKKLTYVLAYSCEEVQDVTWRYSSDHKAVLARRKLCREDELVNVIMMVREECGKHLSQSRRRFVIERSLREVTDMLQEKQPTAAALQGRASGSVTWRAARGELGSLTPYVWRVGRRDVDADNRWAWGYCVSTDTYSNGETGWHTGAYEVEAVQRKVETDWKMAYLARTEGSQSAKISWKFEVDPEFVLDSLEITLPTTVYKSGQVVATVCSGDFCQKLPNNGDAVTLTNLKGQKSVVICVQLSGGEGDVAWQHTQLFRQQLNDTKPPFHVLVKLNPTPPPH